RHHTMSNRRSLPSSIVITGASSGIGKALALHYAPLGATLGLMGRNVQRLEAVATEGRRLRAQMVTTRAIDVRAPSKICRWLRDYDRIAPVDLLIANAGIMAGTSPDGKPETPDESHVLVETNILGVLNSVHPLLSDMITRGHGQIAIVSSLAGFIALPDC